MAVASRSLYSYPLSHVILILCPSSYQPCEFFLYFAFGISGGMQASSSEGEKKKVDDGVPYEVFTDNRQLTLA